MTKDPYISSWRVSIFRFLGTHIRQAVTVSALWNFSSALWIIYKRRGVSETSSATVSSGFRKRSTVTRELVNSVTRRASSKTCSISSGDTRISYRGISKRSKTVKVVKSSTKTCTTIKSNSQMATSNTTLLKLCMGKLAADSTQLALMTYHRGRLSASSPSHTIKRHIRSILSPYST